MQFAKRILLFFLLNLSVVFVISIVLSLFDVRPYLNAHGIDYSSLLIFCFIWGMTGALISLCLSRMSAKWMMNIKPIAPNTNDPQEKHLLETTYRLCRKANFKVMPEVGIYHSPEVNAFATGPTKNRSLIAVSSGLLQRMNQEELEGVIGHEITHITNGDMITMTLLQGVVNAFVMFLARVLAIALSGLSRGQNRQRSGQLTYHLLVYLFQFVFMILGSLIIAAYSRMREFRADLGGSRLAGKQSMIASLKKLLAVQNIKDPAENPALAAFKISHPKQKELSRLFATHPPLEERIEQLEKSA
jgi:heat shock protein HtpX